MLREEHGENPLKISVDSVFSVVKVPYLRNISNLTQVATLSLFRERLRAFCHGSLRADLREFVQRIRANLREAIRGREGERLRYTRRVATWVNLLFELG